MMTHHHDRLIPRLLVMTVGVMLLPWASGLAAPLAAWRATDVAGEATVQSGEAAPVPLGEGGALEPGARLATGNDGRVVLTRGASSITVGPGGRMEIPAGGDDGVRTRIVQAMGSLLFKVEKRESRHFEVETPYLAAVVKGTTFTVSVEGETSAVHVVEGAVEVKALATGQIGLVRPGHTAVVRGKGRGLSIIGGKPDGAGKLGQDAGAGEPQGEVDEGDQGLGRAAAPGQVKRLNAMLGEASVDVAVASRGFVRNAGLANGHSKGGDVTTASLGNGNGNGLAKGLSKDKSGGGNSAASAGAGKAGGGNPGAGKAVGLAKASPAGGNAVGQSRAAAGKALAAQAKAREKARKANAGGNGRGNDDDDDDDD